MVFSNYYILVNKALGLLSSKLNLLYAFVPNKIFFARITPSLNKYTYNDFQESLTRVLGNFNNVKKVFDSECEIKNILQLADQIIAHEFAVLGSGLIKNDPINWHKDFKSGKEWPKGVFYKRYQLINLNDNSDVKVPWELSRCHHLLWLGEAYLFTNDEKYSREIVDQIDYWIDDNPYLHSINWTCAMDVSIRAVNWMYALNMIRDSRSLKESNYKKIIKSLFSHLQFINKNLEKWYPYSGNHYASNLVGLLYLCHFFKKFKFHHKIYSHALNEFFLEVRQQVLPTGPHFERTISYHRLMTELFAYSYLMLKRVGEAIPIDITYRIESMFYFIDHYTKPNGLVPVLGDNDDGRFLPFFHSDFRDHRYLLDIASTCFKLSVLNVQNDSIDKFFVCPEGVPNYQKSQGISRCPIFDHRDAGFVIVNQHPIFLFFTNSSLSCYPDLRKHRHITHTHLDNLAFELSVKGVDFFIDSGTFVYTASVEKRNKFRSLKSHNTIHIDFVDEFCVSKENMFATNGFIEPEQIQISDKESFIELKGCKKWTIPFQYDLLHERTIRITKDNVIYLDDLVKSYSQLKPICWGFILDPAISVQLDNNSVILSGINDVSLKMSISSNANFSISVEKELISHSYGLFDTTKKIIIKTEAYSDINLNIIIQGYQSKDIA